MAKEDSPTALKADKVIAAGDDSRYIWHKDKPVLLRVYNRELQITPNVPPRDTGDSPIRSKGDITTFSRSSRLRLMRKMNRVQTQLLGEPIFITLTHRHGTLSHKEFQYAFLKKFLPKLPEIIPEVACMWRLEPHRNGKPHYHMICWSFNKKITIESEYYHRQIRQAWRDAIGQHDRAAELYSCDIEALGSHRKIMSYVSKYLAKEDDNVGKKIEGRRWATSKNLPCSAISEVLLTREQLADFKQIVETILRASGKPEGLIETILSGRLRLWCWLDPEEIQAVLDYLGLPPPKNQYSRYQECGSPLGTMEEAERLAKKYGHDF